MLQWPGGFELGAYSAHGAVEDEAVPGAARSAAESDEEGDGPAERLGVEEGGEGGRVAGTEGIKEGDAVIDHRVDVGDVSGEAFGEAVALVINGAGGETGFGDMDGCELHKPARLAGEAMDDG